MKEKRRSVQPKAKAAATAKQPARKSRRTRRRRVKVTKRILEKVRSIIQEGGKVGVNLLMKEAKLTRSMAKRALSILASEGLVIRTNGTKRPRWKLVNKTSPMARLATTPAKPQPRDVGQPERPDKAIELADIPGLLRSIADVLETNLAQHSEQARILKMVQAMLIKQPA